MEHFGEEFGLEDWRQMAAFVQDVFGAEQVLRHALTDPSAHSCTT